MQVNQKSRDWRSYYIVYNSEKKIVEKFAFFSSVVKFLAEHPNHQLTYKVFP